MNISSDDNRALSINQQTQATDIMAKYIGEFAFGLNPKARLVEEFLESEKVAHTVHITFGHNIGYPGIVKNNSATHQDFLIDKPTVTITITFENNDTSAIMVDGILQH